MKQTSKTNEIFNKLLNEFWIEYIVLTIVLAFINTYFGVLWTYDIESKCAMYVFDLSLFSLFSFIFLIVMFLITIMFDYLKKKERIPFFDMKCRFNKTIHGDMVDEVSEKL